MPGACLAFTDAVWRKHDPPPAVKSGFDLDYPTMDWRDSILATIAGPGFQRPGRFTLADEAWCDDFYGPMERRIQVLRHQYAADTEALVVLEQLAQDPQMHRGYSDYHVYGFFVSRRRRA